MLTAFHQLPLPVMFFVVWSISTAVCWLLIGLVRFAVPLMGYEPSEPLPIRDALINACGALFALIVAFSAAGIWNDATSARTAVQREADAVENALVVSASLPGAVQGELSDNLHAYLKEVIAIDWPAMAKSMPLDHVVYDQSEKHLLNAIALIARQNRVTGEGSSYSPLLGQLLEVRHARLARLAASKAGTTWAQWSAMWLISSATLLLILICHSHSFRMQVLASHIYVLVAAAAYFVVLAHDRPFAGKISIQPTAMQQLVTHLAAK